MLRYKYKPIPDDGREYIRVANLHPGEFGDDIHITLCQQVFDALQRPAYEALSYVWGEIDLQRIFIDHVVDIDSAATATGEGWLPVRMNLFSALQHLRYTTKSRYLWIDSICIDQDDKVSKGRQVARMGSVYAHAKRVLVWLGAAANNSGRAIAVLHHLALQIKVDWDTFTVSPAPDAQDQTIGDPNVRVHASEEDLIAIYDLFQRPWYDRMWVRQEIILAKQAEALVYCGTSVIPWKLYRSAWLMLARKGLPPFRFSREFQQRLSQLDGFLFQENHVFLQTLRQEFLYTQCQDPRDRIYAIKSLLRNDLGETIRPDYSKTVSEVYSDTVTAYLQVDGDLDIIRQCHFSSRWTGPSWVPDWSSTDNHCNLLDLRMASGMLDGGCEVLQPATLRVYGVVITSIAKLTSFGFDLGTTPVEVVRSAQGILQDESRSLDMPYPGGGTLIDAYTRTLCNDVFRDNHDTLNSIQFPLFRDVKSELLRINQGLLTPDLDNPTEYAKFIERISWPCRSRMFVRTTDGLIGLAPSSTAVGDRICVVFGSRTLFILRSISGSQLQVVGEAYLCGYQHGEAVLGKLPDGIRPTWTRVLGGTHAEVFVNDTTGEQTREDPRLADLGVDLSEYREKLKTKSRPWLKFDGRELQRKLQARGVAVQVFDLV